MVSRLVLGLERKSLSSGTGLGGGGKGSWGPLPGPPEDENSLTQALGWPLTLTVASSWSQGALSGACQPGAGLRSRLPDSWALKSWEVLKGKLGLLGVPNLPPHLSLLLQCPLAI